MLRARPVPAFVAFLVLAPVAWAVPVAGVLGDAGRDADAGGTPDEAMPLAHGAYGGNLTPGDVDWFVFPADAAPGCLSVSVMSTHAMRVGVAAGDGASLTAVLDDEGRYSTLLAVPPVATHLGMLPDEAPWDVVSVGPYSFETALSAPASVGDSHGDDAPRDLSLARPVPGKCFSGHFRADGPDLDVYRFNASAGDQVTLSFAAPSQAATLYLLNATGAVLAGPVSSGEASEVALPGAGTFYLAAQSAPGVQDGTYVVGSLVGPDPPGAGCRPACV